MRWEFLEHTADVKFRAYGKDLEDAFSAAALATTACMTDVAKVQCKEEKEIHVEASSEKALLYDFLEELIVLLDAEGFLVGKVKSLKIEDGKLDAIVCGERAKGHDVTSYVKSVTYSEMVIEKGEEVMVQVVHDI